MAAQVVKKLPEGDDWTYELKFDGYRRGSSRPGGEPSFGPGRPAAIVADMERDLARQRAEFAARSKKSAMAQPLREYLLQNELQLA